MEASLANLYRTILGWVDKVSYVGVVATMALMTALVTAQVVTRYVFNSSIDSADELSRLFFIWAIFLSIPHGVRYGTHVGIDLMVSKLGVKNRGIVFRFVSGLGVFLMAVVIYAATIATIHKWPELMPTINFTAAIYYIAVLICAFHSLLHLLWQVFAGESSVERGTF